MCLAQRERKRKHARYRGAQPEARVHECGDLRQHLPYSQSKSRNSTRLSASAFDWPLINAWFRGRSTSTRFAARGNRGSQGNHPTTHLTPASDISSIYSTNKRSHPTHHFASQFIQSAEFPGEPRSHYLGSPWGPALPTCAWDILVILH